ncbi:carbamoyl-phosphate synthase subunit L ATP-binding [Thecamonas trahens ATCC 50062]|uniref:Carbamoyl-phosphate synthase subunit L ATP-binding n=1 Tax=Thecamonas trahens ATCC 50062 TaxID=461836 RepID=A0A0L0D3Q9_THETB|nr:carbamoyl-phosphate synthase subunit L ATP-binding [Thecamonas trahens ATCC 50062]KNC45938.1 carbamoyl-phosphate synthase subunit L ATP-binding [Thecamonas trahens ATCC 50062]|eukprot:XP_013762921.1 carbamoyl-phosphate synthase subunit L ATP-binding [Thecamonas trahens ATCC 50062]
MIISKVLVANRGEVALRIIGTCRKLGIATVAVYSEADADALHVAAADEAVFIGPPPAIDSYLVVDALIDAARATRCDAVHPGYGFLSERAEFARAVGEAGLVFIGPSPEAMDAMGSKIGAKNLLTATADGVPVIPGYAGADQSVPALVAAAADIGTPLLVKASAGGGGKGMRVVRDLAELEGAIASAKAEAAASFGDDSLLLERYFDSVRHVEFQVFGDAHGNVVHMFERECSVQRRHQKVVEEAPSPALGPRLRAVMGAAAIAIARAVAYVGAGTVEFIVDASPPHLGFEDSESDVLPPFYFLEMNTRLQVEHAVTEAVTGLDLVALQIAVAQGEALPSLLAHCPWAVDQESADRCEPPPLGAAIEVRVYAEDPLNNFLPCTGRVDLFVPPTSPPGVRVDAGIATGHAISVFYDPMVAKLTVSGRNRMEAIRAMRTALAHTAVLGVTTNIAFLDAIVGHAAFAAGETLTSFIPTHTPAAALVAADAAARATDTPRLAIAALVYGWVVRARARASPSAPRPHLLRHIPSGWCNTARTRTQKQLIALPGGGAPIAATYRAVHETGASAPATLAPQAFELSLPGALVGADGELVFDVLLGELDGDYRMRLAIDGASAWYTCHAGIAADAPDAEGMRVFVHSPSLSPQSSGMGVELVSRFASSKGYASTGSGSSSGRDLTPRAPMPCKIVSVGVAPGDTVFAGDTLVVIESMKMQTKVLATAEAAIVDAVLVNPGQLVAAGDVLVILVDDDE